jgi:hypothetical protein
VTASLLRGVRIIIRADSDPARQTLFANLVRSRRSVRLAYTINQRFGGTWVSALLLGGYALATYVRIASPAAPARVLALATHANARRQVARVSAWLGPSACAWFDDGAAARRAPGQLAVAVRSGRLRQAFRICRRLDRRYGFLVSSRAASVLAWYARSREVLLSARPDAILVSSDSNPEEAGLVAAAKALGVPQVFISHAYPTPFSPPLDFTLSILEGEAAVEARAEKGAIGGEVVLVGVEGESAPLDAGRLSRQNPAIGIFTPKAVSWETLRTLVEDCRARFGASRILIRWHPSMLEPPRLADYVADLTGVEEFSGSLPLAGVARECDWVIADENSNVHLPVLRLGIPTVVVRRLGIYPPTRTDQYGFAAHGVVCPPVERLRDLRLGEVQTFFDDCWLSRFRRYDAGYLREADALGGDVRRAVWRVCDAHRAGMSHA